MTNATEDDVKARPSVPTHWYNILPDLPIELPPDLEPPGQQAHVIGALPLTLLLQGTPRERHVAIPPEVRLAYSLWRPTPLRRAHALERHLDTSARIYFKYEGGNISGSHKLNSAIPQAYYYAQAGVERLTTGTGAGQWGTALAAAAQRFDLKCTVYMVAVSYQQKPQRRSIMRLLNAQVLSSPSDETAIGRRFLAGGSEQGNLALALAEALSDAQSGRETRFSAGSGEPYAILHQTVIGLEAREQLLELGEYPDVVVACVGAGSNFGGTAFPFLRDKFRGESSVRAVCVEPQSCPKLTRGVYAYDYTDYSGLTALQKMYTLGHRFTAPSIHAGGLRYHATSKIISALYDSSWIEAESFPQDQVFASAMVFARTEGILPAPESAHAIHGAILEAERARSESDERVILLCVSGHGHFDMSAYEDFMADALHESPLADELREGRASLPDVEAPASPSPRRHG
jgi:tryptophan synthase beta chain